jgi:hypothetical protein
MLAPLVVVGFFSAVGLGLRTFSLVRCHQTLFLAVRAVQMRTSVAAYSLSLTGALRVGTTDFSIEGELQCQQTRLKIQLYQLEDRSPRSSPADSL